LRLAKRNKHTLPTLEKYQAFHDTFLPLLTPGDNEPLVVHTTLVRITSSVIHTLQSEQVVHNTKRAGILNEEDTHGTLLEDLSADPSILLLDFKVRHPSLPSSLTFALSHVLTRFAAKVVVTVAQSTLEREYMSNLRTPLSKEETR
jgi:hypothetical protein